MYCNMGMHNGYEQSLHETVLIAGIISRTSDIENEKTSENKL